MRTEWRVFYFGITHWQFQYVLTPAQLAARALANHSHSEIFEQKRDRSQFSYPMLCLHNTETFEKVCLTFAVAWAEVHRLPSPRGALRCLRWNAEPVYVTRKTKLQPWKQNRITSIFFQALFWGICRAPAVVHFYYCSVMPSRTRSGVTP